MSKQIIAVHHSADYDGLFCREIARKFLPDAELIGWDFGDDPLPIPEGAIYILDLPVDRVFGFIWGAGAAPDPKVWVGLMQRIIWIDHHKSSIESHPEGIPGYRIDGVAACRLAWQWFRCLGKALPSKLDYVNRLVCEPMAVRLAGEYDVWDKRDPNAEVFQFGLRSQKLSPENWDKLLAHDGRHGFPYLLLNAGFGIQSYQQRMDEGVVSRSSFMVEFEGLRLLALNTARCNSLTFAAKDVPQTGHDALCGFFYDGRQWNVSLYHAAHRTDLDLSAIAKKHGGGGHRGACGFQTKQFPF